MLLDDAVGDCQSESGAFFFGGKKRIENPVDVLGGYAFTGVDNPDFDAAIFRVEAGGYQNFSARIRCLDGIDYEVDKSLLNLTLVHHDGRQIAGQFMNQGHVLKRRLLFG